MNEIVVRAACNWLKESSPANKSSQVNKSSDDDDDDTSLIKQTLP
jgi:hypothetical protein